MAIAVKCNSCGHEYQVNLLDPDNVPCPACGKPSNAPADTKPAASKPADPEPADLPTADSEPANPQPAESKHAVCRVSASDVIAPADTPLPRLKTYEELGIEDKFRKAVEEELASDEKALWLGQPSRNRELYPNTNKTLAIIGGILFVLAVALPLLFKGMPFIFPIVLVLLGSAFLAGSYFMNPANAYKACYVVTNRRAILLESGLVGGFNLANLTIQGARRKSYSPKELMSLERQNHPSVAGAGNLVFEYEFQVGRSIMNSPTTHGTIQQTSTAQRIPRGFTFLDDVREPERVIRTQLLGELEKEEEADAADAARSTKQHAPPVSVVCACGARVEAPEKLAGQSVKCPKCAAPVSLPEAEKAPEVAADYREDGPIPAELKEKALAELGTKERLVWMGQPVEGIVLRRSLGYLIGGAVVALLTLIFMTGVLARANPVRLGVNPPPAESRVTGIGIVILLVSLGVAAVPIYRVIGARRTAYALTNRRALVFKWGLLGPTMESYPPSELSEMRRSDSWIYPQGGDVIFRSVTVISTSRDSKGRSSSSRRTTHYGFLAILNPREKEELIHDTLINTR